MRRAVPILLALVFGVAVGYTTAKRGMTSVPGVQPTDIVSLTVNRPISDDSDWIARGHTHVPVDLKVVRGHSIRDSHHTSFGSPFDAGDTSHWTVSLFLADGTRWSFTVRPDGKSP